MERFKTLPQLSRMWSQSWTVTWIKGGRGWSGPTWYTVWEGSPGQKPATSFLPLCSQCWAVSCERNVTKHRPKQSSTFQSSLVLASVHPWYKRDKQERFVVINKPSEASCFCPDVNISPSAAQRLKVNTCALPAPRTFRGWSLNMKLRSAAERLNCSWTHNL